MASIKVLLYAHKTYADGSHPVVIQIIDKKDVFKKVIYKCKPQHWDAKQSRLKSSAPNALEINKLINAKLLAYEANILQLKEEKQPITKAFFLDKKSILIADVATEDADRLDALKKNAAAIHFRTLSTQLLEFRNTDICSIDKDWMDDFVSFL